MKLFERFKKDAKKAAIGSAVIAVSIGGLEAQESKPNQLEKKIDKTEVVNEKQDEKNIEINDGIQQRKTADQQRIDELEKELNISKLNDNDSVQEIKQDKESFRRELGYMPNPREQRKIYNSEEEYKKLVSAGLESDIKEYEEALLDSTISEENKMAIQEMIKEAKINAEDQLKNYEKISKPYIESYTEYDKQKEWLKKNISSNEYKEKLKNYEGMDDSTQVSRLKNLEKDYILDDVNQYDPNTKETTVEVLSSEPEMVHEGEHQIMGDDSGMSDYAKNLYRESYKQVILPENKLINFVAGDVNKDYYGDPMELDSRKKALEWDMEKLGVKKDNETFTDEHYEKLLKLKNENKLSRNSVEFLDRIKREYINKIMNTIAVNDKKSNNYYHTKWDYGNTNNGA